jgi:hypothetical protein
MYRYLTPEWLKNKGLTGIQLLIIVISSFAFIDGAQAGQNHALTLLLITGIIIATIREKWILAGVLAGFLLYKPQFTIGFLILWLVWKQYKAIASFAIIALIWGGYVLVIHGIEPYLAYLDFSDTLMLLPFAKDGFPVSVMATPYALLATLIPIGGIQILQTIYVVLLIVASIALGLYAYTVRDNPDRNYALILALLFPLLLMPHTLVYDLLILIPAFLLLTVEDVKDKKLLWLAIASYMGVLLLPLIGYFNKLALPALIPILFFVYLIQQLRRVNLQENRQKLQVAELK